MNNHSLIPFIKRTAFFSEFDEDDLAYFCENVVTLSYELGDAILNTGEASQGIYLVKSGKVRLFAVKENKEINIDSCEIGDCFGETSIFHKTEMEYSVRASDKTDILLFPKERIIERIAENEAVRRYVHRYAAGRIIGAYVSQLFNLRSKIKKEELLHMVETMTIRMVPAGEQILSQDSAEIRDLFIVRSGEVSLFIEENKTMIEAALLTSNDIFGEKACLLYSVQQFTAISNENTVLLIIPQKTVQMLVKIQPELQTAMEKRIRFYDDEIIRQRELLRKKNRRFLLDSWSNPGWGERVIKRFSLVEQAEDKDCGPACLAMICKYYDAPVSLGKLRELANVTTDGAAMESLVRAGESIGFAVRGIKCSFSALREFDLPLIAHWKGYHYIVIYGISKSFVWIADPAAGFQKMSAHDFEKGWTGNCLLFTPTDHLVHNAAPSPWNRFIGFLKPLKKNIAELILTALLIQFLSIAPPVIIQNILDRVVVHQSFNFLNVLIAGLLITLAFTHITGFMNAWLMSFLVRKLDFGMISHFYKHVLSLPIDFFVKRKTGDIIARFHENNTIRRFMTEGSISTILNTLTLFTYFSVMFFYNVRLTLMLMAFLPPMVLLILAATPKYKDYARKTFFAGADAQSLLVETLGNAEIVKGMGIERQMRLKWEHQYAKLLNLRYRAELFTILIGIISSIFRSATYVALLWTGTRMVMTQELTIGQLMAFHVLIGSVMTPVMGLVRVWDEWQETLVAMERLGDVLDIEPEKTAKKDSPSGIQFTGDRIILPYIKGNFRFENVYFRYNDESPYILKNINFEIKSGDMIAIVGKSGSGKSTIAKLLMGFYKPVEGRLFVDDYDFSMVDMEYYRAQTGYVMQTNSLFSGTISENISLGSDNKDVRRIAEAAKHADADGFIRNLLSGYDQVVGERGASLSQGQIQRICIARALYRNPSILILDEATSALDSKTETYIQNQLKKLFDGKTTLIISHRLSTIKQASKIVVLDEGSIAEQGTHDELIAQKGLYYQLIQDQNAS